MKKIIKALKRFLKAGEHEFDRDAKRNAILFSITGANARWRCAGCADPAGGFALTSLIPLRAPEHRRVACAELLTRINWRIGLGNFDMDFTDGELRFSNNVPLGENDPLSDEVIGHVINGHQTLVDTFIPAIAAVLFASITPEKAIDMDAEPAAEDPAPRFSLN